MSFREKSAWIFFISILFVSAFYFLHVPWSLNPRPHPIYIHGLFVCLGILLVIEFIGHVAIALWAPEDARTPKDEREKLIELRAIRAAHYTYVAGSLLAIACLHIGANQVFLGWAVLLAFVVGELVNYGLRIFYHRRGF